MTIETADTGLLARHGFRPWRALPANLLASLLLVMSFTLFCATAVLIREVGDTIPVVQVIFVRQVIALLLLAPGFVAMGSGLLRPTGLKLHLARGVLAVGAMFGGLTATMIMPLADVTAIQMSEVLMATALAALILGEPVGWRRWTAAVVGFVGVLIMMRPFSGGFSGAELIAVFGALCGAGSMIAVRLGSAHDRTGTVVFWQGLVVLTVVAPFALWFWVWPSFNDALLLGVMGLFFTAGVWLFTAGLRLGETSALAPLHYLRLLMMAVLGWVIYNEVPTLATLIGSVLVLGAASYTLTRNAIRKVKQVPPDTSAA